MIFLYLPQHSGWHRKNAILYSVLVLFSLIIIPSARAETNAPQHLMAQGKYIASMCTTCHQPDKSFEGIPPILGISAAKMSEMMIEYKESIEHHEVMENIAKSLTLTEIKALSLYLASFNPQGRGM